MARLIKSNPSAGALLITALAVGGGVYMLSRTRKKKGASANWYIPSYDEVNAMEKPQITPAQAGDLFKMQMELLMKSLQQPPISAKDGDGTRLEDGQDRGFSLLKSEDGSFPDGAATLAELDKELFEGIKQAASASPQVDFALAMPVVLQKGVPIDPEKNAGEIVLLLESVDLSVTPPKVTGKVMGVRATPNIKGLPAVGSKLTTTTDRLGVFILIATKRKDGENDRPNLPPSPIAVAPGEFDNAQSADFGSKPGGSPRSPSVIRKLAGSTGLDRALEKTLFREKPIRRSDPQFMAMTSDLAMLQESLAEANRMNENLMGRYRASNFDASLLSGSAFQFLFAIVKTDAGYVLVLVDGFSTEGALRDNPGNIGGVLMGPDSLGIGDSIFIMQFPPSSVAEFIALNAMF